MTAAAVSAGACMCWCLLVPFQSRLTACTAAAGLSPPSVVIGAACCRECIWCPLCLQVQRLETDKLSTMGDLQHVTLQKTQKEGK